MKSRIIVDKKTKVQINNEERLEFNKKYHRKFECMVNSCMNKPIDSHSISNSISIQSISENDHVVGIKSYDDSNEQARKFRYEPISHNSALVFKGFCSEHDTTLFKSIDTTEIRTTRDYLLMCYRALCYIKYNARIGSDKIAFRYKGVYKQFNGTNDPALEPFYLEHDTISDSADFFKELYDNYSEEDQESYNFSDYRFTQCGCILHLRTLHYQIPVALNNWHSVITTSGKLSGVLLIVIPYKEMTQIILVQPTGLPEEQSSYLNSVLNNDILLLNLIEKSMSISENWVIKPSVIDKDEHIKEVLINDLYYRPFASRLFEPYDLSIFTELRESLIESAQIPEWLLNQEKDKIRNIPVRDIEKLEQGFMEFIHEFSGNIFSIMARIKES